MSPEVTRVTIRGHCQLPCSKEILGLPYCYPKNIPQCSMHVASSLYYALNPAQYVLLDQERKLVPQRSS
jgi:hypothetical protein